jgi:flagellar basal body-associated protein FliL
MEGLLLLLVLACPLMMAAMMFFMWWSMRKPDHSHTRAENESERDVSRMGNRGE